MEQWHATAGCWGLWSELVLVAEMSDGQDGHTGRQR